MSEINFKIINRDVSIKALSDFINDNSFEEDRIYLHDCLSFLEELSKKKDELSELQYRIGLLLGDKYLLLQM